MADKKIEYAEEININIGFNQPDKHAIDAYSLAETLQGLDQLAHEVNRQINGSSVKISVKILGGFSEGSFDFKAVFDFMGGLLPVLHQTVEFIKQVIEYRRFTVGKPVEIREELPDGAGIKIINHDGNVAVFKNSVVVIGDQPETIASIQKLFNPLAHDADQMELSGGDADSQPLIITKADSDALLESKEIYPEEKQGQIIENELDRILMIRKPDLLGQSKWQFSYDGKDIFIDVNDTEWLGKFHSGEIPLRSHDSLKVKLLEKDFYSPTGEVIKRTFSIQKVFGLIRSAEQLNFFEGN